MSYGQNYGNAERALAQAIADELIKRGIGLEGSADNDDSDISSEASATKQDQQTLVLEEVRDFLPDLSNAANQQILSEQIGALDSPTANPSQLTDSYGQNFFHSLNSLLRGILTTLSDFVNSFSDRIFNVQGQTIYYIADSSGIIATAGELINKGQVFPLKYLLIQNLPIAPEGNLWINFDADASVGAGSIVLAPGESFISEGVSALGSQLYLLGTVQGMQYTLKRGS